VVGGVGSRDRGLPPTIRVDYPYTMYRNSSEDFGRGGSMGRHGGGMRVVVQRRVGASGGQRVVGGAK
jgi:hypothetical protein